MPVDTIFSPSFGNRPSTLVGRESTLNDIMSGLQEKPGSKDRAVVLLGQRGSGKTVLLWELADRATKQGFVVATPTIVSEGMLERIVEKIQDAGENQFEKKKQHLSGGSLGALGFSVGLQFTPEVRETKSATFKLTQLARALSQNDKGLLILIDELQANSPELRQLIIAYQELVGEGLNVAIVMAGLPGAVSATLNDKVLTFLNRAKKVELQPLSLSEVDAYYKTAFKKLDLNITSKLRRTASSAVDGSPYMLQLVGYNIVLYADEDGTVDTTTIDEALETAQTEFESDVCETTLAALSEKDRLFLFAMIKVGTPSKMSAISQVMEETSDYVQKYRKRLLDAGVIDSPERGKVVFAVPYLENYLRTLE